MTSLHTVVITGDEDAPQIQFTCHGDRTSECHSYPDCQCETWIRGNHEHPFAPHDDCWMKSFFDNADSGGVAPPPECLADDGVELGASGPIEAHFNGEYIEWEFIEATP
ncbi:hypothetical protein [Nocardia sp. NPDC049149]|uniref:hypothetical protein n=1 Tax=Nocardia sp. NPDC049149 TaxID=3364315 RepID=UPI003722957F